MNLASKKLTSSDVVVDHLQDSSDEDWTPSKSKRLQKKIITPTIVPSTIMSLGLDSSSDNQTNSASATDTKNASRYSEDIINDDFVLDQLQDSSDEDQNLSKAGSLKCNTKRINTPSHVLSNDLPSKVTPADFKSESESKISATNTLDLSFYSIFSDTESETEISKIQNKSQSHEDSPLISQSPSSQTFDDNSKNNITNDDNANTTSQTRRSLRLAQLHEKSNDKNDEKNKEDLSKTDDNDSYVTSESEGECLFASDSEDASDNSIDEVSVIDTDIIEPDENINDDRSSDHESNSSDKLQSHMNYAALNFSLDMKNEVGGDEKETVRETFGMLQKMTSKEAFDIWIKDMAKQVEDALLKYSHKSSDSLHEYEEYVSSKKNYAASVQIIKPLNTYRESSLSSTAWTKSFRSQLFCRPIYTVEDLDNPEKESLQHCEACGRTNHNVVFKVTLSGVPYDSSRVYGNDITTRHTDWERCLQFKKKISYDSESSSSDGSDSDQNSNDKKQTVFKIGRFCQARSELYHALRHYKFRLFTLIGGKLLGKSIVTSFFEDLASAKKRKSGRIKFKVKVRDLLKDKEFLATEWKRYQCLLELASDGWCSSDIDKKKGSVSELWSNDNHLPYLSTEKEDKKKKKKKKSKAEKREKTKKNLKKTRKRLKRLRKKMERQKKRLKKTKLEI